MPSKDAAMAMVSGERVNCRAVAAGGNDVAVAGGEGRVSEKRDEADGVEG